MNVTALAGGVGAGKLLRGLTRLDHDVVVIGNVADDLTYLGLHVSPDLDSVTYWLAGSMDRARGWGRAGDTFRAMEALGALGGDAWFSLGDLDLATHLYRTQRLESGATLSQVTDEVRARLGVATRLLPVTDDPVRTRIRTRDGHDLAFQRYWVAERAVPEVEEVRYEGAPGATPAPGVLEAIEAADAIVICPSNPAVSIMPILAVPGLREALAARRAKVVGISPIVAGAPLAGMADKLMPPVGLEVSAAGAAEAYRGLLAAWVIDERDRDLAAKIEEREGVRVGVTDTIMSDDGAAERLARFALELL